MKRKLELTLPPQKQNNDSKRLNGVKKSRLDYRENHRLKPLKKKCNANMRLKLKNVWRKRNEIVN